jgi:hypothetical protein
MAEAALSDIHRDERDGVPVFWGHGQGPLTGALMFRVGIADESPVTRGLTHLVEHLALFGLGPQPGYDLNAFVELHRTSFIARGSPDQVVAFMRHVAAALRALPLERVAAEANVLRAEAVQSQTGVLDHLLWMRFGNRGPGMTANRENALFAPDPAALTTWARERFTASNATAWFSGPIPGDLGFAGLPQGDPRPCPEPVALADLRTPAVCTGPPGEIAITFVTDRDDWIGVPWRSATQRLQARLRWKRGLTYAFQMHSISVGARVAHSVLATTCLDRDAPEVLAGILEVLDELARSGLTADELAVARQEVERAERDPDNFRARLDVVACDALLGYTIRSSRDLLDEVDAMTPESTAAVVSRAVATALLMLPPGCPPPRGRFVPYPQWSKTVASGRRFYPAGWRGWLRRWPHLIIGSQAVSLVPMEGRVLTVPYDACAGVLMDADGNLDVQGLDGFHVVIRPSEWMEGAVARDAVLRALPGDKVLRERPR